MQRGTHTPTSYLTAEYFYCVHTYDNATKRICQRAVELYLQEVDPEHQEISFISVENAPNPSDAIYRNVQKVNGYFLGSRTCRLSFSFGHFVARAIDELYDRNAVLKIKLIMDGAGDIEPAESLHGLSATAHKVVLASSKAIATSLQAPSDNLEYLPPEYIEELEERLLLLHGVTGQFIAQLRKAKTKIVMPEE